MKIKKSNKPNKKFLKYHCLCQTTYQFQDKPHKKNSPTLFLNIKTFLHFTLIPATKLLISIFNTYFIPFHFYSNSIMQINQLYHKNN